MALLLGRRTRHSQVVRVILTLGTVLATLWPVCSAAAQEPAAERPTPYFHARTVKPDYVGPVDRRADANEVSEIRIGYFGPPDPQHPLYGNLWRAAQRAIDDANRRGGLAGKPYRLIPAWSDNPWGSGVKQITALVYRDHVWAIIGGVDGPTTHLAEQVVVKARLALVSPVSTDKTVNLTNVFWMFSLAPNDRLVAEVLTEEIARQSSAHNLILITTNDHDAFLLTRELRRAMTQRQIVVRHQFEYQPQSRTSDALVQECLAAKPDDVLVVANATNSVELVRALRQAGFVGCLFGGPACGREAFVRQVADVAGQLIFPQLNEPRPTAETGDAADLVPATPDAGMDADEDYAALQMYDAVQLVTSAIGKAGLNRVAIAHAIRDLSPITGLSGRIEWDAPGSNTRRPTLATIVQGRVVPLRDAPSFNPSPQVR